MGNDSVLHAGISCSLTHKPYFAKLSKDPSHLGDDGDDDGESLAGGDVSGLSELGSSISSAATASSLSRSDSLLSRLACQLQDIQLLYATSTMYISCDPWVTTVSCMLAFLVH